MKRDIKKKKKTFFQTSQKFKRGAGIIKGQSYIIWNSSMYHVLMILQWDIGVLWVVWGLRHLCLEKDSVFDMEKRTQHVLL